MISSALSFEKNFWLVLLDRFMARFAFLNSKVKSAMSFLPRNSHFPFRPSDVDIEGDMNFLFDCGYF